MTKKLAVASIYAAMSVVSLLVASLFPVRISMCIIASLITAIVTIECGHKYAWLTFLSVSIISFLLIPKKSVVYIYILFLGYYPILKLYIERLAHLIHEWIAKIVFFSIILIIAHFSFKTFFMPSFDTEIIKLIYKHLAAIFALANVIFIVYDFGLTFIISFYIHRIKKNYN